MKKSNLDERQEQKLLQIESKGCWLAFWGLLAAMVVQLVVYGFHMAYMAGEWIVYMILALYIAFACLKNGIWDRRLKANLKTNLVVSLVAALGLGVVNFFAVWGKYPDKPAGATAAVIISAICAFVVCFIIITIFAKSYRKKQAELEREDENS